MQEPTSVRRAIQLLWSLIVLGAVTTLLTVVLHESLLRAWALDHPTARGIYLDGGLPALEEGSIRPPAFVPVAVVLFVVVAVLLWVLLVFLRSGDRWARLAIVALVVFLGVATVGALRTGPPTIFVAIAAVSLVLDALLVLLLLHPDTGAFVRRPRGSSRHRV